LFRACASHEKHQRNLPRPKTPNPQPKR
jgi:hypothetical protein